MWLLFPVCVCGGPPASLLLPFLLAFCALWAVAVLGHLLVCVWGLRSVPPLLFGASFSDWAPGVPGPSVYVGALLVVLPP